MTLLSVLCLASAKLVLITFQFYQMPYIYLLVTIGEFVVAFLYCKITQTKVSIMNDVLPLVATPTLHASANRMVRHIKGTHVRQNMGCLFLWDGTLNIVILHLAYLGLVYIPLQQISHMIFEDPKNQNLEPEYITYAMVGYVLAIVPFLILRGAFHLFGRRWRLLEKTAKQRAGVENVEK